MVSNSHQERWNMSKITFAELEREGSELLPERAVLSTVPMPGGGHDGGVSFGQGSHQSWYQAGPDGASAHDSSMYTHSHAGYLGDGANGTGDRSGGGLLGGGLLG